MLLVDDEPTLARALVRLLRRDGYDVSMAASCGEARALSGRYSVGIFDIDLPDGDGLSLAEELLASSVVRRAVFFSGTTNAQVRVRAGNIGPFIDKAQGFPELELAIDLALVRPEVKVVGAAGIRIGESTTPPPSGVRKPSRS